MFLVPGEELLRGEPRTTRTACGLVKVDTLSQAVDALHTISRRRRTTQLLSPRSCVLRCVEL